MASVHASVHKRATLILCVMLAMASMGIADEACSAACSTSCRDTARVACQGVAGTTVPALGPTCEQINYVPCVVGCDNQCSTKLP
ncbi:hypothetical protein TRIUR3_00769 [Triticum urartu]|uniref:Uncharacterized protein n=1 Tax=Triticum urartu TaxID=4572 RepID=M8ATA3_TRIUA|nr:hypothetical protein TRIUR3_00769 [Triticum urartu]